MFEHRPQISETLEWMLQSRQVGDEELVKALVHKHYAEICRFGLSLFQDAERIRVRQFADQVIYTAVKNAQEYNQDFPVKVWLFKLAVEMFQRSTRGRKTVTILVTEDIGHRSLASEARKLIDSIPNISRQAFLLKFSHRLSILQIAYILDLPLPEVERRLNLVGYKWLEWLGGGSDLPAPKNRFQALFSKLWPMKEITDEEEKRITQRILANLNEKKQRKHRLVILGELLLVMITVALVLGMGRLITALSPEPTPQIVYQTHVVNKTVLITPTIGPTLQPTPFPEQAILYRAEGGETLGEIADRNFLNVTILEAFNHIPADQSLEDGQKVMIGVTDSRLLMPPIDGEFVIQSFPEAAHEPLTIHSSQGEIRGRVLQSRENWRTLWAEALVIQYGPQGYIGEPDLRRQQIWIIQPYFNYLLEGENGGEVEYIYSSIGGLVNLLNLNTGEDISNEKPEQIHFLPDLQLMLMPSEYRENFIGDLEVLKQESVAGRETLVFDWFTNPESVPGSDSDKNSPRIHRGRYWVDSSLGLILRSQKFNGNDLTQPFEETIVTKIEINVPIPERIFDPAQPSQTYFTKDHLGDQTSTVVEVPDFITSSRHDTDVSPHQPPPADFAVEKSRLTFEWTSLEMFNPQVGTRIDLFGDGFYLGNIEFADPRQLFCTRSPNGNLITFYGWSEDLPEKYSQLGWFDLQNLPQVNHPLPEVVPYDFAFSPDNQQLAVYGCLQEGEQDCGIYLVDISSGEATHLTAVELGSGLIWNPESSALALQGSFLRPGMKRVLVFDAKTGSLLHDGPFDWEGFWIAPDSPLHNWGVPYPPARGGLELCSRPPREE
jgi:DNA-directed RNA polymerase specialized sigma24 family protein